MRDKHGFTLIELLATSALAGLLMVALLQVTQTTGRTRAAMGESPLGDGAWRDRLASVLRADIDQALRVTWTGDHLRIEGACGWDRESREPVHEPAVIGYRLIENTEGGVLTREQRDLLDLGQQRPQLELLGFGVAGWSFDDTAPASNAPPSPRVLVIRFDDGTELSLALPHESTNNKVGAR